MISTLFQCSESTWFLCLLCLKKAKGTDNMHFEEYNFSCIYLVKHMGRYSSLEYALFFLVLSIYVGFNNILFKRQGDW